MGVIPVILLEMRFVKMGNKSILKNDLYSWIMASFVSKNTFLPALELYNSKYEKV